MKSYTMDVPLCWPVDVNPPIHCCHQCAVLDIDNVSGKETQLKHELWNVIYLWKYTYHCHIKIHKTNLGIISVCPVYTF